MRERLQQLLSEVGESFDYLRSDVRNLSRYLAELEALLEHYRAFAANVTLSTPADRAIRRKLLKKTQRVLGPPDEPEAAPGTPEQKVDTRVRQVFCTRMWMPCSHPVPPPEKRRGGS
jgi:hypothetical protein